MAGRSKPSRTKSAADLTLQAVGAGGVDLQAGDGHGAASSAASRPTRASAITTAFTRSKSRTCARIRGSIARATRSPSRSPSRRTRSSRGWRMITSTTIARARSARARLRRAAALRAARRAVAGECARRRRSPFARVAAGFWYDDAVAAARRLAGGDAGARRRDAAACASSIASSTATATRARPSRAPERASSPKRRRAPSARMMVGTTEFGTARLGFRDKRTNARSCPAVAVAGKTGSLDRQKPYLAVLLVRRLRAGGEARSRGRGAARQRRGLALARAPTCRRDPIRIFPRRPRNSRANRLALSPADTSLYALKNQIVSASCKPN